MYCEWRISTAADHWLGTSVQSSLMHSLFGPATSTIRSALCVDRTHVVYDCTSVSSYIRASRAFGGGYTHTGAHPWYIYFAIFIIASSAPSHTSCRSLASLNRCRISRIAFVIPTIRKLQSYNVLVMTLGEYYTRRTHALQLLLRKMER